MTGRCAPGGPDGLAASAGSPPCSNSGGGAEWRRLHVLARQTGASPERAVLAGQVKAPSPARQSAAAPDHAVAFACDLPVDKQYGGVIAAYAVRALGVTTVFAQTGGHVSPLLVGLEYCGVRVVDVRDGRAAVFAADAHARLTGQVGVAVVTMGPGLANAVNAVTNARVAEVPVLLLCGATSELLNGRGSHYPVDQSALALAALAKHAGRVKKLRDLAQQIRRHAELATGEDVPLPRGTG